MKKLMIAAMLAVFGLTGAAYAAQSCCGDNQPCCDEPAAPCCD